MQLEKFAQLKLKNDLKQMKKAENEDNFNFGKETEKPKVVEKQNTAIIDDLFSFEPTHTRENSTAAFNKVSNVFSETENRSSYPQQVPL